ncbi:MAG: ABC transporter substrate-binding protein [Acutalibacteraceae bacterium]
MKKIFAVIIAMLLAITCFAACGNADTSSDSGDSSSADTEGTASFTTVTEGTLTMATNAEFPPYEYYDGDTVVGIDAEVAALIAEKLGLKLEIADVDFDSIIPGVQSGKYDMGMAGMTVNEERLQSVNFSTSYATGIQAVIVPEDSSIASIDDLAGKKIGVQSGTTGAIYAADDYGEESVTGYQNGALAVEALKSGKVDCVIIDNEPAKAYVAANEGLKVLDTEYTVEDYAICFAKENSALQTAVNAALEELIADGSVKKIVDKYITAE